MAAPIIAAKPTAGLLVMNYGVTAALCVALVVPAAFVRSRAVFATLIGLHIALYALSAVLSAVAPDVTEQMVEGAPPVVARS